MEVSTMNPSFSNHGNDSSQEHDDASAGKGWKLRAAKIFAALGVVGLAGGLGYLGGQAAAKSNSGAESSSSDASDITQARATLKAAYLDEGNPVFGGNLTSENITTLLDMYESDPEAWDDQFMTSEIMESLKILRDDDSEDDSRRLLAVPSLRRNAYRELALSSSQNSLGTEGWKQIDTTSYPDAVTYKSDRATVYRTSDNIYGTSDGTTGMICWVIAEESSIELGDWVGNFDLGSDPIKSIQNYNIRSERCGCESYTLWWCSKYKQCSTYKEYEEGYDGFVKAYNSMRSGIWSRIQSKCNSNDRLVLAGYSRGAGILNALAYVLYKDNLWPLTKMAYVNFGSPRTLSDDLSDEVHGKFTQLRLVYKKDPVPSVPYGWMGYKHFGTMKCNDCGYSEGRDKPDFAWGVDGGFLQHLGYGDWF